MRKKPLLWALLAALLLGGAVVVVPPLLWGDHADYSRVTSIERAPVYRDAALMQKAWALPVARTYPRQIDYQHNPSFCGPTSVVNVMRSLGMNASQSTVLDGTDVRTVLGFVPAGLTLDQLADVARTKLDRKVTVLRDLDLQDFRAELSHANDPGRRYIVNFSRGPLFGRGGGHHSPIAGYLADEDLVLVLDVNRSFKPWLVQTPRLFEAVNTLDRSSKKKRGMLRIE